MEYSSIKTDITTHVLISIDWLDGEIKDEALCWCLARNFSYSKRVLTVLKYDLFVRIGFLI